MTTGEDRNKYRFKNWKLCVLWKLRFRHHGAIKLTNSSAKSKRYIPQFPTVTPMSTRLWLLSISYKPGLFKIFGRDHISYCTTVRGPDVLRNVIFSGYVTFYQINTFFVNLLFFHYWQNVFCGGWNGFPGQIWPVGRSVENPSIDSEA